METTRSMTWSKSVPWGDVGFGALLGAGAAIVMAMYAMIAAATYQGTGFFTPCTTSHLPCSTRPR
jgi:hypothetical protein